MKFVGSKLKAVLKEKDRSQAWLADQIGKSAMAISHYIKEHAEPDHQTWWRMATVLEVKPSKFSDEPENLFDEAFLGAGVNATPGGYGKPPKTETENDNGYITLPMLSSLASAGGGSMSDCEHQIELVKFHPAWLQGTLQMSPDHLCMIQAIGDSMDPTIRSGEILIVDTRRVDPITDGIYVIRLDGALMVKRLQRHPKKVIEIISDNPMFKPIRIEPGVEPNDFEVCGRLVWAGRRF